MWGAVLVTARDLDIARSRPATSGRAAPAFVEVSETADRRSATRAAAAANVLTVGVPRMPILRAFDRRYCVAGYEITLTPEQRRVSFDLDVEGIVRRTRRALPAGVTLPEHISDPRLIRWLISKLSFGGGGGPKGRLSRERLAKLLATPDELDRARGIASAAVPANADAGASDPELDE